ncbi:MAG: penicillin acylase family protein [Solirubrobacterales bacterium]
MSRRKQSSAWATALRRGGLAGAALGALAGGTGLGARWQLSRRPLPKRSGRQRATGLSAAVAIKRDRWGVPHIEAAGTHDLWFAQGVCHAQDRLWQMEIYRRAAAGRVSEIAGRDGLAVDRMMRTFGFAAIAEREARELAAGLRSELEAYCAGVNSAAHHAGALPIEFQLLRIDFEEWRPADMLSALKLLTFGLSTNWEQELLRAEMIRALGAEKTERLDPLYPGTNPAILSPGQSWSGDGIGLARQIAAVRDALGFANSASGSNNWAVSGKLTASGSALLAGDPHLPPSMPGIIYQVDLRVGDRFVRGASIPGAPGVLMGQGNDVAWSFTNAMADVMDLFVERIDGESYEFEGARLPLEVREERILVKGSEPEHLEVRSTHHGPIVNDVLGADASEPLALAFSALRQPALSQAQVRLLEPTSGRELVELLADQCTPVSNLIWADRGGSIGYKTVGRIPIRRGGVPDLPRPGWSGEYEWEGWVPYEELPELVDPECGYLVTANNRIVDDEFPHHISSHYLDGYRAARIEKLLSERDDHDIESFEGIQVDEYSIPGVATVHRLARIEELAKGQREVRAIERLRSWDGRMSTDSVAATIYQALTLRLARETARRAIGDRDLARRWLDGSSNPFVEHVTCPWRWQSHLLSLWDEGDEGLIGKPWPEHVLDCLRGALDDLEERFGAEPERWQWGRVHEMEFPHALGEANPLLARFFNRSVRSGGAQETVKQVAFDPNDPYKAVWAPCWRMVADVADPEGSRWQAFTGQSGQPGSRHYDDLMADWTEGRTQPMTAEGRLWELRLEPPRPGRV